MFLLIQQEESPWKRHSSFQDGESPDSSLMSRPCDDKSCPVKIDDCLNQNRKMLKIAALVILLLGFVAYFAVACHLDFGRARDLVIVTTVTVFFVVYFGVKRLIGDWVYNHIYMIVTEHIERKWNILRW